jgi:hypothetical protein
MKISKSDYNLLLAAYHASLDFATVSMVYFERGEILTYSVSIMPTETKIGLSYRITDLINMITEQT